MINDYKEVKECFYKDECYSVRDNGAVMRHLRAGKKPRKDDGVWTFGVKSPRHGYMLLGQHRVHIIVATAFFGARDSKVYVVDHKDTNKCNNRVDNLRWFTRLENALNNEITRNKIIYFCGSIEAFIENPNILRERIIGEPSLEWMRAVTHEEAKNAYENIKKYWEEQAKDPKPILGGKIKDSVYVRQEASTQLLASHNNYKQDINLHKGQYSNKVGVSDKEWEQMIRLVKVPAVEIKQEDSIIETIEYKLVQAKSPNIAWQKNWKTPSEFVCCPTTISDTPIEDYFNQLVVGEIYNKTSYYMNNAKSTQIVEDKAYIENNNAILVLSSDENIKPFALSKISFVENKFIHESLGRFFREDGARKYFIIEQGLLWEGGDVFDDFC